MYNWKLGKHQSSDSNLPGSTKRVWLLKLENLAGYVKANKKRRKMGQIGERIYECKVPPIFPSMHTYYLPTLFNSENIFSMHVTNS